MDACSETATVEAPGAAAGYIVHQGVGAANEAPHGGMDPSHDSPNPNTCSPAHTVDGRVDKVACTAVAAGQHAASGGSAPCNTAAVFGATCGISCDDETLSGHANASALPPSPPHCSSVAQLLPRATPGRAVTVTASPSALGARRQNSSLAAAAASVLCATAGAGAGTLLGSSRAAGAPPAVLSVQTELQQDDFESRLLEAAAAADAAAAAAAVKATSNSSSLKFWGLGAAPYGSRGAAAADPLDTGALSSSSLRRQGTATPPVPPTSAFAAVPSTKGANAGVVGSRASRSTGAGLAAPLPLPLSHAPHQMQFTGALAQPVVQRPLSNQHQHLHQHQYQQQQQQQQQQVPPPGRRQPQKCQEPRAMAAAAGRSGAASPPPRAAAVASPSTAAASALQAPGAGAVRSKGVLSPKVPIIMPRQFAERVMDPATMLQHGIAVVVRRLGPLPPPPPPPHPGAPGADAAGGAGVGGGVVQDPAALAAAAATPAGVDAVLDVVLAAQVEQFFHAQGYSQYRVLGLKEISCGYHNWRIEMWEALGDRVVRLTISAPAQAAKSASPSASLHLVPALPAPPPASAPAMAHVSAKAAAAPPVTAPSASGGLGYRTVSGSDLGGQGDGGGLLGAGAMRLVTAGSAPLLLSSAARRPGMPVAPRPGGRFSGAAGRGAGRRPGLSLPASLDAAIAEHTAKQSLGLECMEEDVGAGEELGPAHALASGAGAVSSGAQLLAAAAAAAAAATGAPAAAGRRGSLDRTAARAARPVSSSAVAELKAAEYWHQPQHVQKQQQPTRGGRKRQHMEFDRAGGDRAVVDDSGDEEEESVRGSWQRTSGSGMAGGGVKQRRHSCNGTGRTSLDAGRPRELPPRAPRRGGRTWGGMGGGAMAGGGDGGAGTAFGGYSSLPAEDMPPELAGALASSPHPCRKGGATVLSPEHFIHLPRLFFQDNFDTAAVLAGGLRVQVQAGGVLDGTVSSASVASYQNHTGYRYYRLLGFKDVPRRYAGWRVAAWDKVGPDAVRVRLAPPLGVPLGTALARAAALGAAVGGAAMTAGGSAYAELGLGAAGVVGGEESDAEEAEVQPRLRRRRTAQGMVSGSGGGDGGWPTGNDEDAAAAAGLAMIMSAAAAAGAHRQQRPQRGAVALDVPPSAWETAEVDEALPLQRPSGWRHATAAAAADHTEDEDDGAGEEQQYHQHHAYTTSEQDEDGSEDDGYHYGVGAAGRRTSGLLRTRGGGAAAARRDPEYQPPRAGAARGAAGIGAAAAAAPATRQPPSPTAITAAAAATGTPCPTSAAGAAAAVSASTPNAAEVRRIMEAGVAAAVARLSVPASRVRSVVSQNQSVLRPDKGRVYLQKPFVESSLAVTATPLAVQVLINAGGRVDAATYPTKVTLSSSGAHGKAEYLLRLTAPMKHAHTGQVIVGWSALGRQQLLMHLATGTPQPHPPQQQQDQAQDLPQAQDQGTPPPPGRVSAISGVQAAAGDALAVRGAAPVRQFRGTGSASNAEDGEGGLDGDASACQAVAEEAEGRNAARASPRAQAASQEPQPRASPGWSAHPPTADAAPLPRLPPHLQYRQRYRTAGGPAAALHSGAAAGSDAEADTALPPAMAPVAAGDVAAMCSSGDDEPSPLLGISMQATRRARSRTGQRPRAAGSWSHPTCGPQLLALAPASAAAAAAASTDGAAESDGSGSGFTPGGQRPMQLGRYHRSRLLAAAAARSRPATAAPAGAADSADASEGAANVDRTPHHSRNPSLPESLLHAAEQLLHLAGAGDAGDARGTSDGGSGDEGGEAEAEVQQQARGEILCEPAVKSEQALVPPASGARERAACQVKCEEAVGEAWLASEQAAEGVTAGAAAAGCAKPEPAHAGQADGWDFGPRRAAALAAMRAAANAAPAVASTIMANAGAGGSQAAGAPSRAEEAAGLCVRLSASMEEERLACMAAAAAGNKRCSDADLDSPRRPSLDEHRTSRDDGGMRSGSRGATSSPRTSGPAMNSATTSGAAGDAAQGRGEDGLAVAPGIDASYPSPPPAPLKTQPGVEKPHAPSGGPSGHDNLNAVAADTADIAEAPAVGKAAATELPAPHGSRKRPSSDAYGRTADEAGAPEQEHQQRPRCAPRRDADKATAVPAGMSLNGESWPAAGSHAAHSHSYRHASRSPKPCTSETQQQAAAGAAGAAGTAGGPVSQVAAALSPSSAASIAALAVDPTASFAAAAAAAASMWPFGLPLPMAAAMNPMALPAAAMSAMGMGAMGAMSAVSAMQLQMAMSAMGAMGAMGLNLAAAAAAGGGVPLGVSPLAAGAMVARTQEQQQQVEQQEQQEQQRQQQEQEQQRREARRLEKVRLRDSASATPSAAATASKEVRPVPEPGGIAHAPTTTGSQERLAPGPRPSPSPQPSPSPAPQRNSPVATGTTATSGSAATATPVGEMAAPRVSKGTTLAPSPAPVAAPAFTAAAMPAVSPFSGPAQLPLQMWPGGPAAGDALSFGGLSLMLLAAQQHHHQQQQAAAAAVVATAAAAMASPTASAATLSAGASGRTSSGLLLPPVPPLLPSASGPAALPGLAHQSSAGMLLPQRSGSTSALVGHHVCAAATTTDAAGAAPPAAHAASGDASAGGAGGPAVALTSAASGGLAAAAEPHPLAAVGPALQHLVVQSRLRHQAAELSAAAALAATLAGVAPRPNGPTAGGASGGAGLR